MTDQNLSYTERVVDSGQWGPGTSWELVLSRKIPDARLCAAVACVAIKDIDAQEVVLTRNVHSSNPDRRNQWEILAGHIDPLDPADPDGPREALEDALRREAREESGFVIDRAKLFGYRSIRNTPPTPYPELSYMPYYWATTDQRLVAPTDPGQPDERSFTLDKIRTFVAAGTMQPAELVVIEHGLAAAAHELRRVPYEN